MTHQGMRVLSVILEPSLDGSSQSAIAPCMFLIIARQTRLPPGDFAGKISRFPARKVDGPSYFGVLALNLLPTDTSHYKYAAL